MAISTTDPAKPARHGVAFASVRAGLALAALACLAAALAAPRPDWRLAGLAAGMALGFILAVQVGLQWADRWREAANIRRLQALVGQDATPCFTTDAKGAIGFQNEAAVSRFAATAGISLESVLRDHFASPGAVLFRLQGRAERRGAAREDVVTRQGHLRLSVHRLAPARYLWRLEDFQDRGLGQRGADHLSLPMLTANRAGVVLFSNEAMRRLLGGRPKRLDQIFAASPLHSGEEIEVAAATGPVRAVLAEVEGQGERREIYLLPVSQLADPVGLRADFDEVPVAMLRFTAKGALIAANRAAREALHLTPDQTPDVHELFEGLGRPVADWLADVATGRLPGNSQVVVARGPGDDAFLQITLRRHVEAGRPGVLAVLQDATALKTLEAQVVQSQKMQAIGQLAGGVAHDFNNLLTAISGHCDLLLLRHSSEDAEFADLTQISQNANRAAALVGQLLAFSRKQMLKPERLDLRDVLSDLAHLLNRLVGERIDLRLLHGADLGPIRADKRQFEQVIMNLVVNARDAMPDGGRIQIETEALCLKTELRRDRAVVPPGDYALIRVRDEGTGISADQAQKIFEPFYTTKRQGEGTGLGLSTAYGIVKQSGGFIFVDSVLGEGCVFQLYFPIFAGAEAAEPVAAPARRAVVQRQGAGVVLLVEDEAPVRAFAARALRLRGYTVMEAENAEAALRCLQDSTVKVDLFVTDVVMPGMDGPTWVRQALAQHPDTKVIFISGYAEDALAEGQARVPNSVFLPKPFSLSDLTETVQVQLQ